MLGKERKHKNHQDTLADNNVASFSREITLRF